MKNVSIFPKASKYWIFSSFKDMLTLIEKSELNEQVIVSLKDKRKFLMDNFEKVKELNLIKSATYGSLKWLSFRYTTVKAKLKEMFGEWTISKKKAEAFV